LLRKPTDLISFRGEDRREIATKKNAVRFLGFTGGSKTDKVLRKSKIRFWKEHAPPTGYLSFVCDAQLVRDLYARLHPGPPKLDGRPSIWLYELRQQIDRLHGRKPGTNTYTRWITDRCRHLQGQKLNGALERRRRQWYVDRAQADRILERIAKEIAEKPFRVPKPPKITFDGIFEGVAPHRRMTIYVAARELGIPREKLGRWVAEGEPKSEPREIPGRAEPLLSVLEQDVLARKNRPRRKPFRFDGIYEGVAPNRRLNLLTASRVTGVRKDSLRYRVRNGTLKSQMRLRPDVGRKEYTVLEADVLELAAHDPPHPRRKRPPAARKAPRR
jgi:hypothetical protein